MPTAVTLRLVSDDPAPARIADAAVALYPAGSLVQLTGGITNAQGEVSFLLPDDTYDVRVYKPRLSVLPRQPQRIVVDSDLSNVFVVPCHQLLLPETLDPALCRITGRLLNASGSPIAGARLSFLAATDLVVSGAGAVLPQKVLEVASNDTGYFDFTLLRGLSYEGAIPLVDQLFGEDARLDILVPNRPAASLDTLLFPLPASALFSVGTKTLSKSAGTNNDVSLLVTYSDGSTRSSPPAWTSLNFQLSDESVVSVTQSNGALQLVPLAPGSCTIELTRSIRTSARWQSPPPFVSESLVVTVTE